MRNFVAKNDYNRASVHLDRSKEPQLTVEDGLLDYESEQREDAYQEATESYAAWLEYKERMDKVLLPRDSLISYAKSLEITKGMTDQEIFDLLYNGRFESQDSN